MISIQNLTRCYGNTVAVRDVSVDIGRGEIVGLLGHNGAGKTTMMKVLTGYLDPTRGTVTVDGHDVEADRVEAQRRLGYLPENAPLYTDMLVQEYLLMMAELRGVPADRRGEAVVRAARRTGITPYLVKPIATLSKGYRQRVGIAQAIVHDPDVLILDEPTNGLDPTQIESIRELIRDLGKTTTILLSTHILQEVEAVCDRVLVMINGDLAADAPLAELTHGRFLKLAVTSRATGVAETLSAIAGVTGVAHLPSEPQIDGFTWYKVETTDDDAPAPEVLRACVDAGWEVASLSREHRRLEDVFRQLQQERVERRGRGGER